MRGVKKNCTGLFFLLGLWFLPQVLLAQVKNQRYIDSILQKLPILKMDTNRVKAYDNLSFAYRLALKTFNKTDQNFISALYYADQQMQLAIKLKYNKGIVNSFTNYGLAYERIKDYEQALSYYKKGYDAATGNDLKKNEGLAVVNCYVAMSRYYIFLKKYDDADKTAQKAFLYFEGLHDKVLLVRIYADVGYNYQLVDKARYLMYNKKSLSFFNTNDTSAAHIYQLVDVAAAYHANHELVDELALLQQGQKLLVNLNNVSVGYGLYYELGTLYDDLGEYEKALLIRQKAVGVVTNKGTPILKVLANYALGQGYVRVNKYDKAIYYDDLALNMKLKNLPPGIFKTMIQPNTALAYYSQKNYVKALTLLDDAGFIKRTEDGKVRVSDTIDVSNPSTITAGEVSALLARIYRDAPDSLLIKYGVHATDKFVRAQNLFIAGLNYAKQQDNIATQGDIYQNLYLLYEKTGDFPKAYDAYKNYIALRDSLGKLTNKTAVVEKGFEYTYKQREDSIKFKQLFASNQLKTQLQLSNKEEELQQAKLKQSQAGLQAEQNKRKANLLQLRSSQQESIIQKGEIKTKQTQTYYLFGGIAALLGLSFFIARNYSNQRKANKQISFEKARSEELLLNILPADVAEELKESGKSKAKLFDEVTVLFTDFVNFTTISELLTPEELVDELHHCFKAFDGIMSKHDIEKIKTIGDAYLAVAGLPHADENHALNTITAALEIQTFIQNRKGQLGNKTFDIRIGIHSGSVVAGIVGVKKFAYDIWGDTVNTAARMEQNSEPGKINVSEKTYELVKDKFAFTYRGEIEAKNKGALKMYFVENGKSPLPGEI